MNRFIPLTLFAFAFGVPTPQASAAIGKIDPFTFCNNTCKPPHCNEKNIAEQCKKTCSEDSAWKHVASLQMSSSSKEFRTEKDKGKKDGMLYNAPIAKCLNKVKPIEEPSKADADAKAAAEAAKAKDILCTSALKSAMDNLQKDQATLETQKRELESTIKTWEKIGKK